MSTSLTTRLVEAPSVGAERMRERFAAAADFREYVERTQKNHDLWVSVARLARAPEELVERAAAVPGPWHLLVLSEDWCGDAVNTVPVVAALVERLPNWSLRVLGRDANPDLMDAHLSGSRGTSRAIPVVMVLDAEFVERGWWGSRPHVLQAWIEGEGGALPKEERYPRVRQWYARDRGRSTLEEIVALVERAAERAAVTR